MKFFRVSSASRYVEYGRTKVCEKELKALATPTVVRKAEKKYISIVFRLFETESVFVTIIEKLFIVFIKMHQNNNFTMKLTTGN